MTFNSLTYLGFLFAVVATFWALPVIARRALVMLASIVFYASWDVRFVWLPVVVAGVVFMCGKGMQAGGRNAKRWMWIGSSSLLVLLAVFKYRAFVLENLARLGIQPWHSGSWSVVTIAFPLGISFYTFEAIGYLIDVRQGRVKMPGFVDLCLFFLFWPNILSGPIVRARELMPQLGFARKFEPRLAFEGVDRIVWGLVQKNVIANVLGTWVDRGFGGPPVASHSTLDSWFLAIAFGLQIYFDFAGYTNLAIGAARLIGVELPENFRHPYHASNPADFWNRWHMTLSRWIRDYLFFPINARWKGAPGPLYASLIGVMALVGLWHGAGWGFLIWGTMHGVYLVTYRAYEGLAVERPALKSSRLVAAFWRIATLAGLAAAWVPFRAAALAKTFSVWSAMFFRFTWRAEYNALFYTVTLLVILFCVIEPLVMGILREVEEQAGEGGPSMFRIVFRPVAHLLGFTLFLVFDQGYSQFIYSQF